MPGQTARTSPDENKENKIVDKDIFLNYYYRQHSEYCQPKLNMGRLKKYCGHSERGFLGFGEASAKEQVQCNPVTEPKRSQNPKRPLPSARQPDGYSIYLNALLKPSPELPHAAVPINSLPI
jgi:hypothetical protein